jgi:transposase InsO family protein
MGLGRYVVDAIVLEGRSPSELAKGHHISRSWIYELLSRYRSGGYAALEPRSRRPRSCAHQVPPRVQAAVLKLRRELSAAGHDAGPQTIAHHLSRRVTTVPSTATIWRILQRHGLITPQPHKRPRSSFTRFEAQLPNELWQADTTHWMLEGDSDVEILNLVDDHSRVLLASVAFTTVKAADVVRVFFEACGRCGLPTSLLSDNGAVFSGSSRRGKVLLESELERLGIRCIHSTPYHPQTCGNVERFHQTLKRYLARQPRPRSSAHLQLLQPAPTAPRARTADPAQRVQRAPAGEARAPAGRGALPRASGPGRWRWPGDAALPQPPAPHLRWPSASAPAHPSARRRRARARHPRGRSATWRAHLGSAPRLSAAAGSDTRPECPATGVLDVLRHHTVSQEGFEPPQPEAADLQVDACGERSCDNRSLFC